jgi:hypothetical protein
MDVDADAEMGVDAEADVSSMFDADLAAMGDNSEEIDSRNSALSTAEEPFDDMDWLNVPTDKQLPGDLVRLRHAPGAVPLLNEEILPRNLLPNANCKDPNHVNDVRLWKTITKKLRSAKTSLAKYKKWTAAAQAALKRVGAQIRQTTKNSMVLNKAIRGMTHQRRQVIKRLKAYRLKNDLDMAQKKMEQLTEYGNQLAVARAKATGGNEDMIGKIKLLKKGMQDLKTAGQDA